MASSWLMILLALVLPPLFHFLLIALLAAWWKPRRIQKSLQAQGITGPPHRFLHGNLAELRALGKEARSSPMPQLSHDILARVIPHYYKWSKEYGTPFVYWFGYLARLNIVDPEMVKEIVFNKSGHFVKPTGGFDAKDLVGDGLPTLDGEKWARHRRIVNPAFLVEKLKAMTSTMVNCATEMMENWQRQINEDRKEIDVHKEFRTLTADVIAHTAFGSSFAEGKGVFEMQHEQQLLLQKIGQSLYIPGFRFIPTENNRYRWRLDKQLKQSLRRIIESRIDSTKLGQGDMYGSDLLGLMMAANSKTGLAGKRKNLTMGMEEIMDECKTFFFAGHETTSVLLTWTLMLLSVHTEWQEKARAEVVAVCGENVPNGDLLGHLKIVGMVLNESLRLYPPAVAMFREAERDMKLSNNMVIPEGTNVAVQLLAMHHDPELWGEDANEFKPERFSEGTAKACSLHPMAFLPFSVGPRNCVGQNFAAMEAKVVLSMILQRFAFRLSPGYIHAPMVVLTLQPQFGMQIIFENLM